MNCRECFVSALENLEIRATRARARPFVRASTRSLARPSRGNHARAPIARARRSMGARDRIRLERVDSSCF